MACFGIYVNLPRLAPVARRDPWAAHLRPCSCMAILAMHINVWPDHYPGWSAEFVSPSLLHQVRSSRVPFPEAVHLPFAHVQSRHFAAVEMQIFNAYQLCVTAVFPILLFFLSFFCSWSPTSCPCCSRSFTFSLRLELYGGRHVDCRRIQGSSLLGRSREDCAENGSQQCGPHSAAQ